MYKYNTKWTFPKSIGKATKHNIAVGDIVKFVKYHELHYAKVHEINGSDLVLITLSYELRDSYFHFMEDDDNCSQYDKSIIWEGEAVFTQAVDNAISMIGSCRITHAGVASGRPAPQDRH